MLVLPSVDHQADPNLTVDEGCVVLGDANNIMAKRGGGVQVQVQYTASCEWKGTCTYVSLA